MGMRVVQDLHSCCGERVEVMDLIKFPPYFKIILQSLNFEGVEYLIVGGWAVRIHGYARATRDLDIWTSTRQDNAEKLFQIIHSWAGENPHISPELFAHPNRILRMSFPPVIFEIVDPILGQKPMVLQQFQVDNLGQVEILTVQTAAEFYECYANRVVVQVDGVPINVIGLQDLKKIKQAGDRPKDRLDLAHLATADPGSTLPSGRSGAGRLP